MQQHRNTRTDTQTELARHPYERPGEPLPITRLTNEEAREVIRLFMEESGLDAPPDTPTIQDMAEGLGISLTDVERLRVVIRERQAAEQEEQGRKQQAEAEQRARLAEAEARTAEAKAQVAEAKQRQRVAEAQAHEELSRAETVRNPAIHQAGQTTYPMARDTAVWISIVTLLILISVPLLMYGASRQAIRPVPQWDSSPLVGHSISRELCYGCRQPNDGIESVHYSTSREDSGAQMTDESRVSPSILSSVRLCPNCRQPGIQEKYVEMARKHRIEH